MALEAVMADLYEELENDRANQEKIFAVMGGGASDLCWLMTIDSGASIAAAILSNRWLSGGMPSWLGVGEKTRWNAFAKVRHRSRQGVPLLAAIHVTVKWTQ
jgi:hypothetical protein